MLRVPLILLKGHLSDSQVVDNLIGQVPHSKIIWPCCSHQPFQENSSLGRFQKSQIRKLNGSDSHQENLQQISLMSASHID